MASHDDWRLPNVRELLSIVDYGQANPSIHPIFGPTAGYAAAMSSSVGRFRFHQ